MCGTDTLAISKWFYFLERYLGQCSYSTSAFRSWLYWKQTQHQMIDLLHICILLCCADLTVCDHIMSMYCNKNLDLVSKVHWQIITKYYFSRGATVRTLQQKVTKQSRILACLRKTGGIKNQLIGYWHCWEVCCGKVLNTCNSIRNSISQHKNAKYFLKPEKIRPTSNPHDNYSYIEERF